MGNIKVLGIDLAKNVFQLHGIDERGKRVLSKRLPRKEFIAFMATLPVCVIGLEACAGSHYWARYFKSLGHEVRMMSPQFVKPYVKSNKTDRNDAEAIAEACTRGHMRFVAVKSVEQQDVLMIHRSRELAIRQRTAQANQIRGMLNEYGVILAKGIRYLKEVPTLLDAHQDKLTAVARELINHLYEQFKHYDSQVKQYDEWLERLSKEDGMCQELQKIPGIGPLIASAAVATVGDAKVFKNGRELSAWLGLVPKQHSSGDKIHLGGISKHGDSYLRKLLIQGARNIVTRCETKKDKVSGWVAKQKQRGGFNKAAVALANKNARTIWAILATGECYRQPIEDANNV